MNRIVGVDFDNTIVNYDFLIRDEAIQRGLIDKDVIGSKKEIRDIIRQLPNGEVEWQRIQASIYGPRMQEAKLVSGVRNFFERCKQDGIQAYIISHKTKYANFDEASVNLRDAALLWMESQGFFGKTGFGITREDIFFGATRLEKIGYIRRLMCTDFIDDLEEMFLESAFPNFVRKILFVPHGQHRNTAGIHVTRSWVEIKDCFFNVDN